MAEFIIEGRVYLPQIPQAAACVGRKAGCAYFVSGNKIQIFLILNFIFNYSYAIFSLPGYTRTNQIMGLKSRHISFSYASII